MNEEKEGEEEEEWRLKNFFFLPFRRNKIHLFIYLLLKLLNCWSLSFNTFEKKKKLENKMRKRQFQFILFFFEKLWLSLLFWSFNIIINLESNIKSTAFRFSGANLLCKHFVLVGSTDNCSLATVFISPHPFTFILC